MPEISDELRMLTEGSLWIDDKKRTILIWRIHWANAENVESFDLLVMGDFTFVNRPAKQIEQYVRDRTMQYCRDCKWK